MKNYFRDFRESRNLKREREILNAFLLRLHKMFSIILVFLLQAVPAPNARSSPTKLPPLGINGKTGTDGPKEKVL